jgi:hypothetical protein
VIKGSSFQDAFFVFPRKSKEKRRHTLWAEYKKRFSPMTAFHSSEYCIFAAMLEHQIN